MVEFNFNDSAYLGQSPGNTTHESLAYLGTFNVGGVGGVCVECDDEAYLGLAPGRTTASRVAYIGLFDRIHSVPPVIPPVIPPVPSYSHFGGGGGGSIIYDDTKNRRIPDFDDFDNVEDEEMILIMYHLLNN